MKIYIYIRTGYIHRYRFVAEGLLFIMKFEKLPCFKKKKNTSKCIVHLLQQLQRTAAEPLLHHIIFIMCKDLYHNLLSLS